MAEPATNTVAGVAIATGAITLTGSIFGLQFDALLFGLFGGLISLAHLGAMTILKTAATLLTAVLLGGLSAPWAVAIGAGVAAAFGWTEFYAKVPSDAVRLAGALVVGFSAQWLIGYMASRGKALPGAQA